MQFGGKPIEVAPNRIFNCAFMPADDWRCFGEAMFLLLGGTGVGYSVQKHHVEKLPEITKPNPKRTRRFLVNDSIEGWADAVKALVRSYFQGGSHLRFDFSDIRPKGAALITSGKPQDHNLFVSVWSSWKACCHRRTMGKLTPIEVHDMICHIATLCWQAVSEGLL